MRRVVAWIGSINVIPRGLPIHAIPVGLKDASNPNGIPSRSPRLRSQPLPWVQAHLTHQPQRGCVPREEYLTDVLTRLPGMLAKDASTLTPANWLKARNELRKAA